MLYVIIVFASPAKSYFSLDFRLSHFLTYIVICGYLSARSRKKTRIPRHIYSMVICVFIQNLKGKKTVLLASYVLHIQAHKNVPEQQSFTVVASGEMILLC